MKRILLLLAVLFGGLFQANATHLMGGEITIQDLGNGDHQITLIAYRDTIGIPMTTSAQIEFAGPNNQQFSISVAYDSVISGNLLPMYPYGVEIYLFYDTVTFPTPGIWNVSWKDCCRNAAIQNLSNPLSESMLLQTELLIDTNSLNSTPFFLVPAAIFLPVNTPWQYNPLPFDPDGDSLYWSLDQPLNDIGSFCAGYVAPSSDPNNVFSIDPITGTISWTANVTGNFVASILVDQYRNGQWVGEIRRDMQFIVVTPSSGFPLWANLTNLPQDTTNHYSFDLVAGQGFKLEMLASHTDLQRPVFMGAYSEIFKIPGSNASFSMAPTGNGNEIKGTLNWMPTPSDIRPEPYLAVFRISDRLFTDDKSVKLNIVTAVGNPEYDAGSSLSVYPNPASDILYLDFSNTSSQQITLEVYNLIGKKVIENTELEAVGGKNLFVINTSDWNPGSYIVSVKDAAGVMHNKVVMVR